MTPLEIASRTDGSILVRRWLATWIDFGVLFGVFAIPKWILGDLRFEKSAAIWLILIALYFPVFEGLFGRTPGKLVAGTVVVDEFGFRPGLLRATIRTLLRFVEVNPVLAGGAPAGFVVLFSKSRQRLGDMAARTFVIKRADLPLLLTDEGGTDAPPAGA